LSLIDAAHAYAISDEDFDRNGPLVRRALATDGSGATDRAPFRTGGELPRRRKAPAVKVE
jgi:hypothetical protein